MPQKWDFEEKIKNNELLDGGEMQQLEDEFYDQDRRLKDRSQRLLSEGNSAYWGAVGSDFQAYYSQKMFNKKFQERGYAEKFMDGTFENNLELLDKECFDPAFRWALSANLKKKDGSMYPVYKKCEELLNRRIMMRTLEPVDSRVIQDYQRNLNGEPDTSAHLAEKQEVLAKMLFIEQLAGMRIHKGENAPAEFLSDENIMIDTLVHGGRTCMILPKASEAEKDNIFDPIVGGNEGKESGIYGRSAASHSVSSKSFDGTEVLKEHNSASLRHQYGMDLAVGGFGQHGLNGNAVTADGTFGHMYMKMEPQDDKHYGCLMFGIEGSAPRKKNQTGQKHDMSATKNKQSAFLADKNGVGKQIGGRVVDLSNVDARTFNRLMNSFHESYSALQKLASEGNVRAKTKMNQINAKLMGKPLSKVEMLKLANDLGINERDVKETYVRGHVVNEPLSEDKKQVQPLKKPGFFTRLKAKLHFKSAMQKMEAYEKAKKALADSTKDKIQQAMAQSDKEDKERDKVYENRLRDRVDLLDMVDEKIPNVEQNEMEIMSFMKGFKQGGGEIEDYVKQYYTGKYPVQIKDNAVASELRDGYKSPEVLDMAKDMTDTLVALRQNMYEYGAGGANVAKDLTSSVLCGKMIGKLLGLAEKYPVLIDKKRINQESLNELKGCAKVAEKIEESMRCEGDIMHPEYDGEQKITPEYAKNMFMGRSLRMMIKGNRNFHIITRNYDDFSQRMDELANDPKNAIVSDLTSKSLDEYRKDGEYFWYDKEDTLKATLQPESAKKEAARKEKAKEKEAEPVRQAESHAQMKKEKPAGRVL